MERIFRAKHHLFLLFLLHCKQAYATDESCNYVINIPEKGHLRTLYRFLWTCKHLRAHKSWTIFLLPPFWYVALASSNTWSAEYLRHFFIVQWLFTDGCPCSFFDTFETHFFQCLESIKTIKTFIRFDFFGDIDWLISQMSWTCLSLHPTQPIRIIYVFQIFSRFKCFKVKFVQKHVAQFSVLFKM